MTLTSSSDLAAYDGLPVSSRRRRRALWFVAFVVLVGGGVVIAVVDPFAGATPKVSVDNAAPTSIATVARRTLSAHTQVDATLGYAGSYNIVNQTPGTITLLPAVGQVISQGQIIYKVDGHPVVLMYGQTPAYRELAEGARASDVTGPDVQQLNAALVALGFANQAQLDPSSNEFSAATKTAVKKLQASLGVPTDAQNGALPLGSIVFQPGAARITTVPAQVTVGGAAQPGATILQATSMTRLVTIALEAAQQSQVKAGDAVTITLPDHRTTPGVVFSVGTVATTPSNDNNPSASSTPTIDVNVVPTRPGETGNLDQAPVAVSITTATAKDALVVPVTALLSLAGGGYGIEMIAPDGAHHIVPVTVGLFDDGDGVVQISGPGVAAGQRVVVPGS
jgi:hypothetical protein